ncbi:MAG: C4-dicarboxylate ABC transporter substrate-binding protein [Candidatus Dadabacteria bacterium]|nr:MAG: C4-dicarboxylate ABC transporter substrate-binding protein [Candidatus Dadabacteria bacterium]
MHSKLAEAWCREIEKRTDGEVRFQYFPGQTLTKGKQAYDGVVSGISDVALSLFGYTPGRFPVMEAVDLPFGYPNAKAATEAINAVYRQLKPKELDDVKVLYLHAHGPGLVHTKSKPVRTMEDMKGLKFRATGFAAKIVKALGGTPVAMPMPEAYQALSKGVVDGALFPLEALKGWRLGEVVKYTTLNHSMAYTSGFFVVMNKQKWNSLSDRAKKVIDEVSQEWIPKTAAAWDEIDEVGRTNYLENQGGHLVELAPEEAARWKKAVEPVIEEYVKEKEARGLPGRKAVEIIRGVLARYR